MTTVPPGWPREVRPPDAPDWEATAVAWLFDLCPPDYRAHEVLRRYPVALSRFAAAHVAADGDALRRGLATARAELRDALPVTAVDAVLLVYERELARSAENARAVALVGDALGGRRFRPRL